MTNTNLLSLLKLSASNPNMDYDELFEIIAKELLSNYVIRKGNKQYTIIEIEFYLFNKNHPDVITYPRHIDAGHWFFHQSGVDLTFESNGESFGGILIRGIQDSNGCKILGPLKCVDELWDNFNALTPTTDEYPYLQLRENNLQLKIHRYKRWIPAAATDKSKKMSEWIMRIEHAIKSSIDKPIKAIEECVFDSYYRFASLPIETEKNYLSRPKLSDIQSNSTIIHYDRKCHTSKIDRGQIVGLSALLPILYPATCERLLEILKRHGIPFYFLKGTKDIWCRDYMPVQTPSGKLIQFRYDPSYLKDAQYAESRSDVRYVDEVNNIKPIFSEINLDGGNVVMFGNKAIITDRVFSENPDWARERLLTELSELLECEIIIIPAYKTDYDFTGHADGMIRFIDGNTVLVNDLDQDLKYMRDTITKAINKANLRYINFPWFEHKIKGNSDHAIGIYINYLEVGNLIVMPVFGVPGNKDAEALAKLKEVFPEKIIETIDYNDIAMTGGILNCSTWVITV